MKKRQYALLIVIICAVAWLIACKKNKDDEKLQINIGENCNSLTGLGDPYYQYQWHLKNTGQTGSAAGFDVNAEPVWLSDITGCGVVIAIVDDGMDGNHEDLKENVINDLNHNYVNPKSKDVSGLSYNNCNYGSGCHGTSVAGVAAGRLDNGIGIRGAAGNANLIGYNLLWKYTSENQHDAMKRNIEYVDISINSWGPQDGIGQLESSDELWKSGIDEGLAKGRDGKGIVYIWAAGNGGEEDSTFPYTVDNSNYDGYANYYGVIAVNAIGEDGKKATYAENGANIWVSTYSKKNSSFSSAGIITTDITGELDLSYDMSSMFNDALDYTDNFGGTSSTAPLVGGIVALMLEANAELSWRDVKLILAQTAVKNDAADADWSANAAGYLVNHKYGFGSIDAFAAVTAAKAWSPVGILKIYESLTTTVNGQIPDANTTGLTSTLAVSGSLIKKIEYVTITVDLTHGNSGDLDIALISPSGTVSTLSEVHMTQNDLYTRSKGTYFESGASFTFGTARCLDESADGTWTLQVRDMPNNPIYGTNTGTFNSWNLKFFGRS